MRKIIIISTILLGILSQNVSASQKYGDWAEKSIQNAIYNNIITNDTSRDYYTPITRLDIAKLIAASYLNNKGNYDISPTNTFSDISDPSVDVVSALGVMNGYGDGTFLPEATTSRQEMAKIILTYQSALNGQSVKLSDDNKYLPIDYMNLSNWAKPYVVTAIKNGLLKGYSDGSFSGLNPVSWQEAIVMIDRVSDFNNDTPSQIYSFDFNLNVQVNDNTIEISWDKICNDTHTLTIIEQRLSRYEGDIAPNNLVHLTFNNESSYIFNTNPNKKYTVKIACQDYYFEKEIYTEKLYSDDMYEIKSTYPSTKDEAEQLMVDVTVPIWTLSGSTKTPSTATIKVHNAIAAKVKLIFEEIYNGDEKFPIKDLGGYNWRGGTSEHNGGTAIDINSNENYCIYNNGTTIGSYWKPYEDPYSITPYGDVIRAFEKYGFTWGGDSWSNPKDYMHFSYLGT